MELVIWIFGTVIILVLISIKQEIGRVASALERMEEKRDEIGSADE